MQQDKQSRALDKKAENARELGLDYEPVQDMFRKEWYSFDPAVEMSDFSKSVYWLENSPNTRDKLASKELRRLHEENIRLKKCLFQMQEAAKQLAAQPAPVQEPVAVYGYCPICGAEGVMRERRLNGYDKCAKGHTYPSSKATPPAQPAPVKVWEAEGYDALMKEMQVVKARNIRQHAEIERLSALVRAQQITIDKLEKNT